MSTLTSPFSSSYTYATSASPATSIKTNEGFGSFSDVSVSLKLATPVAEPGNKISRSSTAWLANAPRCPTTSTSAFILRCTAASASTSPHGTTWWPCIKPMVNAPTRTVLVSGKTSPPTPPPISSY